MEALEIDATEEHNNSKLEAASYILPLINLLPEKYHKPLIMAELENKKQKEIAETLSLSLTAVKSRIQRARILLKKEMLECCHLEFGKQGEIISFDIKAHCAPLLNEKTNREKNIS